MDIRSPHDQPKDPYEDINAERVEREKFEKEKERERQRKKKSKLSFFLWIQMMLFFKKLTQIFMPAKQISKAKPYEALIVHLEKVKDIFEKLKTIDFSEDMQYLQYFSDSWHEFLEDASKIKKDVSFYPFLEKFIHHVQYYPKSAEHSLGYYLGEFAGSEWVPFPFMELLKKLHQDHLTSPHSSTLKIWTEALNDLLFKIKAIV